MPKVYVGTTGGLFEVDPGAEPPKPTLMDALGEGEVTSLAPSDDALWAIMDHQTIVTATDSGAWREVATSGAPTWTSLLLGSRGVLVGTEEAHLLELRDGEPVRIEPFELAEGREGWYTPWGGPPAVRSMTEDLAGRVHVNVHVGGIPRSIDGLESWSTTIDVDADVHQVLAHPREPDVVLAACAFGLGISRDGGASWRIEAGGLHAAYSRAVAVAGDSVLVSVSTGPGGARAAIYRGSLGSDLGLERCTTGLPEWFESNIDTGCLAASGSLAVSGTTQGKLFGSEDGGASWSVLADGLPAVRALAIRTATRDGGPGRAG
jgi:hypothetical protein